MEFRENFVSFSRHRNERTVLNILDIVACYIRAMCLALLNRRLILYRSVISDA